MQPVPFTKRLVAQAVYSTAGRRLLAAAVGVAVAGSATLMFSSHDSVTSEANATRAVERTAASPPASR
jgi:hypothetical protein